MNILTPWEWVASRFRKQMPVYENGDKLPLPPEFQEHLRPFVTMLEQAWADTERARKRGVEINRLICQFVHEYVPVMSDYEWHLDHQTFEIVVDRRKDV